MERSRFAEEIQEQYRAFKDSQAAFKLAKKVKRDDITLEIPASCIYYC